MPSFITTNSSQTKKIGALFAKKIKGGEIICLAGELGSGKTTFVQGLLNGLKIQEPVTSPTFGIIKYYQIPPKKNSPISEVYHLDAYRIKAQDLLALDFLDFAGKKNSLTLIEWPEKVRKIIPANALWIKFNWLSEKEREIILS